LLVLVRENNKKLGALYKILIKCLALRLKNIMG